MAFLFMIAASLHRTVHSNSDASLTAPLWHPQRIVRREQVLQKLSTDFVRWTKFSQHHGSLKSAWIKAKPGKNCSSACEDRHQVCDDEKHDEIDASNMTKIANSFGLQCQNVKESVYPTVPVVLKDGDCLHLPKGRRTKCARVPDRSDAVRLCVCRDPLVAWSVVNPTGACESFFHRHSHVPVKTLSGVDLEGCKKTCAEIPTCQTVDFYAATMLCNLYDMMCRKSDATSNHDEASSWAATRR
eukprot:TRINITY_DN42759_c0_g1_i2.p1 TRINITY_DN42759_c0_g1~~TRINITY_DN42759_c0_g1_i2.p1  ORF type:complete len:243 (-),score=32.03 TRINITY_DN42759_c0_g1_i2:188-916(-)